MNSPRSPLKKSSLFVRLKGTLWRQAAGLKFSLKEKHRALRSRFVDVKILNVCKTFPSFQPNSSGVYAARSRLTVNTINQIFPVLSSLADSIECRPLAIHDVTGLCKSERAQKAAHDLKQRLDYYGSDKARRHNYHFLYGWLLQNPSKIRSILEIGLGSNYADVVSNMGIKGKPGASLRAFRDYLDKATVFGADVDVRILFQESRIQTFFVDQTDSSTFLSLDQKIPGELDLVIDDGLHSPDANINTLKFGLQKIRIGGYVVIEDIAALRLPIWRIVAALLPDRFQAQMVRTRWASAFVVRRLA